MSGHNHYPKVCPERFGDPRYMMNWAEVATLLGLQTTYFHKFLLGNRDFPEPDITFNYRDYWMVSTIRKYMEDRHE